MTWRLFSVMILAACPVCFVGCGRASQQGFFESAAHAAPSASPASKAGAASLYVETSGNDSTGERGRADKPFATLAGAYGAKGVAAGDLIRIGPGTFSISTMQLIPHGVSVWAQARESRTSLIPAKAAS